MAAAKKIKVPISNNKQFSPDVFEALAKDLQSKRIPLPRVTVTDNVQTGLRAIVRDTLGISYHVNYDIEQEDGSFYRPYMKLGSHNPGAPDHITVADARHLAKVVRALAAKGIDVQEGLHAKLIRELKKDGEKWKP